MTTGVYKLSLQCGATYSKQFQFKMADGDPFDFTGWTFDSQIRVDVRSPSSSAEFTVTSPDPENGYLTLSLPASASAALTGSLYNYDIRATSGSQVSYLLEGRLVVSGRITR